MAAHISRWVLRPALALAVAAGWAILAPSPAHGQSITGLGQADQVFNRCQYATAVLDGSCAEREKADGVTDPRDGSAASLSGLLTLSCPSSAVEASRPGTAVVIVSPLPR